MNLDLFYSVDRVVIDGESPVKSCARQPGGSAANTIYALAKLGIRTGFTGAVGADKNGKLLLDSFDSVGVDTSHILVKSDTPTGTVVAITDRKGHRALYVSPGANNLLGEADLDMEYFNGASLVHFSAFVSESQFKLQNNVAGKLKTKVKLSFAPGALYTARGFEALKKLFSKTHTLFINRTEIKELTGGDFRQGAGLCLNQGCRQVAITLGKGIKVNGFKGLILAYIRDANHEYFIPTRKPPGNIVDTTGAGDAFSAGFLYGMLKDKDPYQCGLLGSAVASFSLTRLGARSGLPTREQLLAAYPDL